MDKEQWTHSPEHDRENMRLSLKALNVKKVGMRYLHGLDPTTPYIDTLREVNNLYKEGCFDKLAILDYMAWEAAQSCEVCEAHDWVKPSGYQGIYNSLNRTIEAELIPAHGIRYVLLHEQSAGWRLLHGCVHARDRGKERLEVRS